MEQIVGRGDELAELDRRLESAIAGSGSAIVLVGEVGIGKSALVEEVDRRGRGTMTVLRATGVEDETALMWSGVASLVRPLRGTTEYTEIAPARRQVLETAVFLTGDGGSEERVDPYAVSLALLDLITHAATRRPVLVLVDDLHWIDPPSARALAFLGRRLDREYVALVASSRPDAAVADLEQLALASLTPAAAAELLRRQGVHLAAVRAALIDAVGTNPLLLTSSVAELDPEVRRGSRRLPDPVPFPSTVMDGARRRLAILSDEQRLVLAGVAVLGRPSLADARRMALALGADLDVLEDAERAGVVEIGSDVAFSHPTLRTAAYLTCPAPDRRRIHGLAGDVSSRGPVVRAMHRSAAVLGPDAGVAAELAEACEELVRRGALAAAAEQFARSADLSPDPAAAMQRRLRAAELHLDLGLLDDARPLLASVEEMTSGVPGASLVWARARLLHLEERVEEACELLQNGAAALAASAPDDAAHLLLESLAPLVRDGRLAHVVAVVGELQALRPHVSGPLERRLDAIAAMFALLSTRAATGELAAVEALLQEEGSVRSAFFVAEVISPVLAFAHRDEALGAMLDGIERSLRDRAALVPLISVLAAQQLRHFGIRQPLSIAAGEEAIRLANELGRPRLAMVAAFGLAVGAAVAGDAVAHQLAADVLVTSRFPHADATRRAGVSVLHFAGGRVEQAVIEWEQLAAVHGVGNPLITWEADYLEALTMVGRQADARRMLDTFDEQQISRRLPGAFDRVGGILTDDEETAAAMFTQSVAAFRAARNILGEARTELCWGERLRRRRRRTDARLHLERAVELFRTVGLPSWARRAEIELAATGVALDTTLPVHALLSPRELRVARLVAAGASNRDIGVELFLSERTVESYLSTIFRKLQVRNRRELTARSMVDPVLRPSAD